MSLLDPKEAIDGAKQIIAGVRWRQYRRAWERGREREARRPVVAFAWLRKRFEELNLNTDAPSTRENVRLVAESVVLLDSKTKRIIWSHSIRLAIYGESHGIDTSALLVELEDWTADHEKAVVVLCRRIFSVATAESIKAGGAEPTKKEQRQLMGGSRNRNHEIDNAKARSFLIDYPKDHAGGTATIEKLAEHLECSVGHAQKLPAWKAEMELRAKRPKIQSLSGGEAQGPAELGESLDDLIKDSMTAKRREDRGDRIRSGERS
ncbi:MAG: hypothetical protein K8T25_23000 [Planctomycetia bacterium]|nr:hypothetical protein [Planctomycetia bacterium]